MMRVRGRNSLGYNISVLTFLKAETAEKEISSVWSSLANNHEREKQKATQQNV